MLDKIVPLLLEWFETNQRDLPWRRDKNPYYIWISEIMLQQTRVGAVKPFFYRFIEALPTVKDLADCEENKLLKLWEGLGYYNRVRNLQKAAQILVEKYQGKLPASYEELLELPGIGSYTAGAIGSIGFDLPVPAVDGNVLRVISRVLESYDDIMKQSVKKAVEKSLREVMQVMSKGQSGAFNQALMELGAMVCVPNGAPKCDSCPLSDLCIAKKNRTFLELPVKSGKKSRKIEEHTILIIQDGFQVALQKRPNVGLLRGMYQLPNELGHLTEEQVLSKIEGYGFEPLHIQKLEEAKHIFSHVEWRMIGYRIRVASLESGSTFSKVLNNNIDKKLAKELGMELDKESDKELDKEPRFIFVEQQEAEQSYAIPAAFSSYVKYMNIRLGQEKYQ